MNTPVVPMPWRALLPGLVALAVNGCTSKPQLAEVSGIVTLDGKPATRVLVEFVPDQAKGGSQLRSTGETDQEGRFQLLCDDQRNGAAVGAYRVLVRDLLADDDKFERGSRAVVRPSRIPDRYGSAINTPLRADVKAGPQTITLEVTSK
jgi:hypothetical protein